MTAVSRRDEAWVEVSDEGGGIPSSEREAIFQPFRRRLETREAAPGAGLGLSVVRRVVRAHGGTVEVESEVGKGSMFRIRLPTLAEERSEGVVKPSAAVSLSGAPRTA